MQVDKRASAIALGRRTVIADAAPPAACESADSDPNPKELRHPAVHTLKVAQYAASIIVRYSRSIH